MLDLSWLIVRPLIWKVLWHIILTSEFDSRFILGWVSPLVQKWKIFEDGKSRYDIYRLQSKNKKDKNSHPQERCTNIHSWKNRSLCSSGYPKYKLIEDLVHYILSGCDVHYGLRCHDKLFQQVLMFFRAIARWETSLHGVEFVPSLNLCHGQRHRRTMTNTVEGDLLNTGWNVMETRIDKGATGIDGINSCVCC